MDRVRILRTVFLWAAWISLPFAVLAMLATLMSLPTQQVGYGDLPAGAFIPQPTIMTLAIMPYHLILPVTLFFAWGVLTALCEIHDRLEEQVVEFEEEIEDQEP